MLKRKFEEFGKIVSLNLFKEGSEVKHAEIWFETNESSKKAI